MKLLKLLAGFLAFGFVLAVVAAMAGLFYVGMEFKKPGPLPQETFVIIERGEGVRQIADKLLSAGAIQNPHIFKIGTRLADAQSDLKAGEYLLTPRMSAAEVMSMLRDGKVYQRQFTVPEGRTGYEIVQILQAVADLTGEIIDVPKEGSLLPETYSYQKGNTRLDQLAHMQTAMDRTLAELCPAQPCWPEPLTSLQDVITLASIVEKETGKPEERRRVAGVFLNRLRRGIPLQTDPTVIYAITGGKHENGGQGPLGRRLLKKDLEIDSPYNTYKYPGLPPGPIANPGRASIEAVLHPEEHGYIYFVADGTGGHLFAETLAEHNRNVANWRKIRRAKE